MADTFSPKARLGPDGRIILVRVKIERAKKHLVELERELIEESRHAYAHSIMTNEDPQTGHESQVFRTLRVAPFNSIAVAGDIIQNLRSSLDHLAYQLILAEGNRPTSANCFPICEDRTAYERDKARRVKGMSTEAKEAIDLLEPYGGGNNALWRLHRLNNIDKHRLPLTVERDFVYQADWIEHWSGFNTFVVKASEPDFCGIFSREEEDQIQLEIGKTLWNSQVLQGDALIPTLHQLVNVVEGLVLGFKPLLQ